MRAVVTFLMGAKGRIFGTRANELSKIPYFRGFTTCIHGLEVML